MPWPEARLLCACLHSSELVSITSPEENSFIVQLQQAGGGGWLWLGGHDIVEDNWVWTDGAQWGFTNWLMTGNGRYVAPDNGDGNYKCICI